MHKTQSSSLIMGRSLDRHLPGPRNALSISRLSDLPDQERSNRTKEKRDRRQVEVDDQERVCESE